MANLCKRCNRPLKSEKAIKDGYGPVCKKKVEQEHLEFRAQFHRDVLPIASQFQTEPSERYIVSDERVVLMIAGLGYEKFRSQHPRDKLEALCYADHIQFRSERADVLYRSADLTEEPEWFRQLVGTLEAPRIGVVRVQLPPTLETAV